ncbi:MAG TPA: DMT family transporter [Candidatus Binatia bacterium]|nr:DMT family transporter [Candidatus Binatia bacterium]
MSIWSAIALSVLATTCYQVGLVLQKIAADKLPRLGLGRERRGALRAFFRSPTWLAGTGITILGWIAFLKAVANAPVSIVQPVLGFGLALLALFSLVVLHERLRPLEWVGIALMLAGLVLLGLSAAGATGTPSLALGRLVAVSLVFLGLLAAAVPVARAGTVPAPIVLGFGAGTLIGLAALYTKGLFLSVEAGLPALAWLFVPLMVGGNLAGMGVQQAGFQQGRALIVVAMNAVTNKVVTIAGGMVTLGELLPAEPALAAARIVGFVAILGGTVILARFGGEQLADEVAGELARV